MEGVCFSQLAGISGLEPSQSPAEQERQITLAHSDFHVRPT